MQLFERNVSPHELIVFTFELVLISGSLALAVQLQQPAETPGLLWKILLVAVLSQLCLYYNDFYDLRAVHSGRELVIRLVQGAGVATIILGIIYLLIPSVALDAQAFLTSLGLVIMSVLAWRLAVNHLLLASPLVENTLIVGTDLATRAVAHEIVANHEFTYRVVGFVADTAEPGTRLGALPVLGGIADLGPIVKREDVQRIVVGMSDSRLPAHQLVDCKLAGAVVEDAQAAYERLTGKVLLEELTLSKLVFADGFNVARRRQIVKRAWDLFFSGAGLVVALPFVIVTALLVWIGSGRPVLYRQVRVGQHGQTFTLYKFRSMRVDAEAAGPAWAREDDDRVTAVGRFIRLTRLDELPQLWNVLTGDMSFVGPRPERPEFVDELGSQIPFYHLRHAVKPGITGWAQIKYRYADSFESAMEKLRYDLYYVKHLSPVFDLTIVVDTVKTILFRMGSQ